MTRPPHGPRQIREYADPLWAPPTRPGRILQERREPVPVDLLGSSWGSRTYGHLAPMQQVRFDVQMAAWLAGCELIRAHDHAWFGIPVPPEKITAWESARDEWHFERVQGRGFAR